MKPSPQAQSVIDDLKTGKAVSSGGFTLGPLDAPSAVLLDVLVDHYDTLTNRQGVDQVNHLRATYAKHAKPGIAGGSRAAVSSTAVATNKAASSPAMSAPDAVIQSRWRLMGLRCMSVRGVAPPGEVFEFAFDGKSNLIFGPNGSGKSSLLASIVWVLTGNVPTDAEQPTKEASLYGVPSASGKSSKIRDWPVVVTLPGNSEYRTAPALCWATIELKHGDGKRAIWLRRTLGAGLEVSDDGAVWNPCGSLLDLGIHPLDIQLSLVAPTVFGRRTIEGAEDSRSLLSLMLGYDDLDALGDLASRASGNRTGAAKSESEVIDRQWEELRQKLVGLPQRLSDGIAARDELVSLAAKTRPAHDEIEAVKAKVSEAAAAAERNLVMVLGLRMAEGVRTDGVADKLTVAVSVLEKGVWQSFPSLAALRLEVVLPPADGVCSHARLDGLVGRADQFVTGAASRIRARLEWWRKEVAPGSKASLLIRAAQVYDPAKEECPVCEQPVGGLPIKDELASMKGADAELAKEVRAFFTDLEDELKALCPPSLPRIAGKRVGERILADWAVLRNDTLGPSFASLTEDYEASIKEIAGGITEPHGKPLRLLPEDTESSFLTHAAMFAQAVAALYEAIAVLYWAKGSVDGVGRALDRIVCSSTPSTKASLLSALALGKEAAGSARPLGAVREELAIVATTRQAIAVSEGQLALLEEMKEPLNTLKLLAKYAESEVGTVFGAIKAKTLEIWQALYPESSTGLTPGRLVLGKGKDRTIEALLSSGTYEVPGQHFANAGLQRSIALSFYFALLDRHPKGLDFVLMDDPILSLDEDHRERWSDHVLRPRLNETQVILATHQRQYLLNCGYVFDAERVIELNPRGRSARISHLPGDRLKRAEAEIKGEWLTAPTTMRKYLEDVLLTLNSYSPTPFYNASNLKGSLDAYRDLPASHPLAGGNHAKIIGKLTDPKVTRVLNPGSHSPTESDLTEPMVKDCLRELFACDSSFRREIERLDRDKAHSRRGRGVLTCLASFPVIPTTASWAGPVAIQVAGRAAARSGPWAIDLAESPSTDSIPAGAAVVVAGESLDPVAERGQWVLLACDEAVIHDGDLVAAEDADGRRYLRRIWSVENKWILQPINPVRSIACVITPKLCAAVRKVVGVLYEPTMHVATPASATAREWIPHETFDSSALTKLRAILVEGDSMDPIARKGQKVLVHSRAMPGEPLRPGIRAAVVTACGIGNVIKKVFPARDGYILVSPNPVDAIPPEIVRGSDIREIWPLAGVLFESGGEIGATD